MLVKELMGKLSNLEWIPKLKKMRKVEPILANLANIRTFFGSTYDSLNVDVETDANGV